MVSSLFYGEDKCQASDMEKISKWFVDHSEYEEAERSNTFLFFGELTWFFGVYLLLSLLEIFLLDLLIYVVNWSRIWSVISYFSSFYTFYVAIEIDDAKSEAASRT